ncbi:MAG: TFIIB-type zinc finger domain-containing protein [Coriobacteriales bacterium]|jgi:hypothetical protein|nr:TFIIB-type zinc finger domain-containing protein [Coriobacteriales bacterium]
MELVVCTKCGASDFFEHDGFRVCSYCHSKYRAKTNSRGFANSSIALDDDVAELLQKCVSDPANAKRYANLVLDIDPTNAMAMRYL